MKHVFDYFNTFYIFKLFLRLMLIDELIEGDGHLIVKGNSVLFHDDGGQTRKPRVANGIHEFVHLLALQQ
jgi:hypothetical protein